MTANAAMINRLRNQLINVKYEEVLMWSDEALVETIFQNGLPWIKLLQWLLSELGVGIDTALDDLTGDKCLVGIKDTVTSLGFCSPDDKNRVVSGLVIARERQKLCLRLIESIELMRKYGHKTAATDDMMFEKLERLLNSRCLKFAVEDSESKETPALPVSPLVQYVQETVLLQEQIAIGRQKVHAHREKLEASDENISASEYLEQLLNERDNWSGKLTSLVESVKCLSKEAEEVFRSELSILVPVYVAVPIEMPTLNSLSEKVDNLLKLQSDQKVVAKCEAELCNRMGSLEKDWSIECSASLSVFELHVLAGSVVKMHEMTRETLEPAGIEELC